MRQKLVHSGSFEREEREGEAMRKKSKGKRGKEKGKVTRRAGHSLSKTGRGGIRAVAGKQSLTENIDSQLANDPIADKGNSEKDCAQDKIQDITGSGTEGQQGMITEDPVYEGTERASMHFPPVVPGYEGG